MKLPKKLKSLDDLDEKYHELYTEQTDGTYLLNSDDPDSKRAIDEFRKNNIALNKQLEELKQNMAKFAAFGDLGEDDIKAMLEAKKQVDSLKDDELIGKDGKVSREALDEYANRKVEAIRKEYEKKVNALSTEVKEKDKLLGERTSRLGSLLRDSSFQAAVEQVARPRAGALKDILGRAASRVRLNDDQELRVYDDAGEERFGPKGASMTLEEYAAELVSEAPHLFEPIQGGGGGGNKNPTKVGGRKLVIDANDPLALGQNFKGVAKGEVETRYSN